jgi:hypothetical protein
MKGVTNTLEVIALGAALTSAIVNSREDGEVNAADLVNLIGVVPHVQPALEDISEVPEELKDLDEAELGLILDRVKEVVGQVGDEKALAYAEAALKIGLAVFEAVQVARA